MLRSILFLARADLAYTMRQKETLLWTFVMPIVFMYFLGVVTGGSGAPGKGTPPAKIVLVEEAEKPGFLVDEIVRRLEDSNFKVLRNLSEEEVAKYARRLTIPAPPAPHKSLADAALAGAPVALRFRRAGSGISREMDLLRVKAAVYTVLADFTASRLDGAQPSAASFEVLRDTPRKVELAVRPAGKRKTIPSGYAQTIPGTLVMFTMMILLTGGAIVLVIDRRQGLLRRLASTPITAGQIVIGKWLGKFCLAIVQIGFAILVSLFLFDMDWGPRETDARRRPLGMGRVQYIAGDVSRQHRTDRGPDDGSRGHDDDVHGGAGRMLVADRGHAGVDAEPLALPADGLGDGLDAQAGEFPGSRILCDPQCHRNVRRLPRARDPRPGDLSIPVDQPKWIDGGNRRLPFCSVDS